MTNRSFLEQCLLLLFSLGLFAPVCAQSPAGVPNPTFWFENTIEPNAMLQGKIAPAIDLAHELAHAYDAIHGLMNFDKIEVFGVPGVKEIEKNELYYFEVLLNFFP